MGDKTGEEGFFLGGGGTMRGGREGWREVVLALEPAKVLLGRRDLQHQHRRGIGVQGQWGSPTSHSSKVRGMGDPAQQSWSFC